jgi:hypothetical protein
MRRVPILACAVVAMQSLFVAAQVAVHVEPTHVVGPRELAGQTEQAVIRDYLESWKTMQAALSQNQPELLNRDFVGTAKDRLSDTIRQQAAAGIHTRYQDLSHNLQIVFYSPEGLSVELTDTAEYEVQVFDKDKQISTQQVHSRYVVVMTPAEVRWRVRVLQEASE